PLLGEGTGQPLVEVLRVPGDRVTDLLPCSFEILLQTLFDLHAHHHSERVTVLPGHRRLLFIGVDGCVVDVADSVEFFGEVPRGRRRVRNHLPDFWGGDESGGADRARLFSGRWTFPRKRFRSSP